MNPEIRWNLSDEEREKLSPMMTRAWNYYLSIDSFWGNDRPCKTSCVTPDMVEKDEIFAAYIDGSPVGMCALRGMRSRIPVVVLDDVWVEPDHRREGIASKLVTAALEYAREKGVTVNAWVLSGNDVAKDFYSKLNLLDKPLTTCYRIL